MAQSTVITSRDRCLIQIRNMILTGQLKSRERLIENDLATQLSVSRTPVREAIRDLVQVGLLVSEPYKGVRVADIDVAKIIEIYELRSVLECFAAELAALRITDAEIQALIRLNEEMRQPNQWAGNFAPLNEQFHQTLNVATRNHELLEIINGLRTRVRSFRLVFHYHPVLMAQSVKEHDEIISALLDRNPNRARAAMQQHIKSRISDPDAFEA